MKSRRRDGIGIQKSEFGRKNLQFDEVAIPGLKIFDF
jgi:hypothetical protein